MFVGFPGSVDDEFADWGLPPQLPQGIQKTPSIKLLRSAPSASFTLACKRALRKVRLPLINLVSEVV